MDLFFFAVRTYTVVYVENTLDKKNNLYLYSLLLLYILQFIFARDIMADILRCDKRYHRFARN